MVQVTNAGQQGEKTNGENSQTYSSEFLLDLTERKVIVDHQNLECKIELVMNGTVRTAPLRQILIHVIYT